MGSKYQNPGKVDVDKAEQSILSSGGGKTESKNSDGIIHTTIYGTTNGARLSYDRDSDGNVYNVHTGRYGEGYTTYGNKK